MLAVSKVRVMRVLLVEDDEFLGDGIRAGLKQYGHAIDWVRDGQAAHDVLSSTHETFDIIILDLGLPKRSGLDVLKTIREKNDPTPVVILTARDTVDDRIKGLDAGSDDYMTKPFDLEELCARMRAMQRRSKERAKPIISHGDITLDPASHVVTLKKKEVMVARREFALLQKLLENAGRVISREQLNQTLYGWGENIDSNALEVHIHNLRKRFGAKLIRTIRGVGYMVEKKSE
ncbi:DNA-binding response regulator [Coxiella burnetii]|nr:DNA-binding response regulator [Coxiella burnetii]PNT79243.1 DNA-binding response regulator [Coxiella burnetii]PNT80381.1 DNA-binding response regulator [Coxiella burnetii]PNT83588.1 DNA-binding response regulator [Coxiella burnetii]PNT87425.1 DNA-binding response regulator [Coxiella burnetii]